MSRIEVRELTKQWGAVDAVDQVSFTVAEGSLTFNNDGTYSFDPGSDFDDLAVAATRDVTFTYTATNVAGSSQATVTINVNDMIWFIDNGAGGAGDAAAERGLAYAGRTDEAENRPLLVGLELSHRQVLDDALFDLFEAGVVLVQDLAGFRDVDDVVRRPGPRQVRQPLQVAAE